MNEKLLEKLRKIHAHMESARIIGSDAEAQAFAATLNRLMLEHDLSMTDLEYEAKSETIVELWVDFGKYGSGVEVRPRRVLWMEKLADIVASAFNCRTLVVAGSNRPVVVGFKQDTEVAEFMIVTLIRTAASLAGRETARYKRQLRRTCSICGHGKQWHVLREEARNKVGGVETGAGYYTYAEMASELNHEFKHSGEKGKGYRVSFLTAFIRRVHTRLMTERRRVIEEAASSNQALVRLDNTRERVNLYIEEHITGHAKRLGETWNYNAAGVQRGEQLANKVSLRANAMRPQDATREMP